MLLSHVLMTLPIWLDNPSHTHRASLIICPHTGCLERTFGLRQLPSPFHYSPLPLFFFSPWKSVREHSLARATMPQTAKPLTPQCFHCQILSVFSWKLSRLRCFESILRTDKHTTPAARAWLCAWIRRIPLLRLLPVQTDDYGLSTLWDISKFESISSHFWFLLSTAQYWHII